MRKAFTLIELLVVIGIIGLLAALLFPVFVKVREKGRQTVCVSNLQQLGLAMLMYTHDNDEMLPSGMFEYERDNPKIGLPVRRTGVGWAGQVYPYVKNTKVFACPDEQPVSTFRLEVNTNLKISPRGVPVSYALNDRMADPLMGIGSKVSRLKTPADDVLLFEINGDVVDVTRPDEGFAQGYNLFSTGGSSYLISGDAEGKGGLGQPDILYATGLLQGQDPKFIGSGGYLSREGRHSGGAHYLLADGHARWLRPEYVCPSVGGNLCQPNTRAFFSPRRDEMKSFDKP